MAATYSYCSLFLFCLSCLLNNTPRVNMQAKLFILLCFVFYVSCQSMFPTLKKEEKTKEEKREKRKTTCSYTNNYHTACSVTQMPNAVNKAGYCSSIYQSGLSSPRGKITIHLLYLLNFVHLFPHFFHILHSFQFTLKLNCHIISVYSCTNLTSRFDYPQQ